MRKRPRKPLPAHDKAIMAELLAQPGIRENVRKMKPEVLRGFKRTLLQKRGFLPSIYTQYTQERKRNKAK